MNANYLDNYGSLLLMFILAAGLAGAAHYGFHDRRKTQTLRAKKTCLTNAAFAPRATRANPSPSISTWWRLIFILFDIEAIFLYPWALVYHDLKVFGFVEMLLYIIILLVGYIFLWKKGALDWNR